MEGVCFTWTRCGARQFERKQRIAFPTVMKRLVRSSASFSCLRPPPPLLKVHARSRLERCTLINNIRVINHFHDNDAGKFDFHAASRFNSRISVAVYGRRGWRQEGLGEGGHNRRRRARTRRHETGEEVFSGIQQGKLPKEFAEACKSRLLRFKTRAIGI